VFGFTGYTSTTPCAATTHLPAVVALHQLHCAREYSSTGHMLVVNYFYYTACPGASAHRAARHAARRTACRPLIRLRRASGCLGTLRSSSRLSSSTTSPTPRVRVPRHVTRFIVDYSVRCDFVLRPHWLHISHSVRRDYLSRGNTGSTSSTSHAVMTLSSGRIASTIHLD
jgi:hypothetical protein